MLNSATYAWRQVTLCVPKAIPPHHTPKQITCSISVRCDGPLMSKLGIQPSMKFADQIANTFHCGRIASTLFNSLWPSDAIWRQRSESTLAQVMADGTKPLPEPMLTYHQWGSLRFIWGQFHKRYLSHESLKWAWKLHTYFFFQKSPRGQWVKHPNQVADHVLHISWRRISWGDNSCH